MLWYLRVWMEGKLPLSGVWIWRFFPSVSRRGLRASCPSSGRCFCRRRLLAGVSCDSGKLRKQIVSPLVCHPVAAPWNAAATRCERRRPFRDGSCFLGGLRWTLVWFTAAGRQEGVQSPLRRPASWSGFGFSRSVDLSKVGRGERVTRLCIWFK